MIQLDAFWVGAALLSLSVTASAQTPRRDRGLEPLPQASRAGDGGRKWAIVIGVDRYEDPKFRKLDYGVADARLVARTLVDSCGYPPECVLSITDEEPDPARRPLTANLRGLIPEWLGKPVAGDTLIVFFAGHGYLDDLGQGVLALHDCKAENPGLTGYRIDDLRNLIHHCKATRKLLILDCCHAGGVFAANVGARSPGLDRRDGRPLHLASLRGDGRVPDEPAAPDLPMRPLFLKAKGLITLASCHMRERSYEWPVKGHGLFTFFLAQGLAGGADANRDKIVDSDELYGFTLDKVTTVAEVDLKAEQTPQRIIGRDVVGVFALASLRKAPARHALLIGIDRYQDAPALAFAVTDVQALGKQLGRSGVDRIAILADRAATRPAILDGIRRLAAAAASGDDLIVAFRGHGLTVDGRKFLVPADVRRGLPEGDLIRLDEIYEILRGSRARTKLLIVDAPEQLDRKSPADRARDGKDVANLPRPGDGIALILNRTAGVALDDPQIGQGVFFHFLIGGLEQVTRGVDGPIPIPELVASVSGEMGDYYKGKSDVAPQMPLFIPSPAKPVVEDGPNTNGPRPPAFGIRGVANVGGGVRITEVIADSPASRDGLEAGDVIGSINEMPIRTVEDCSRAIDESPKVMSYTVRDARTGMIVARTIRLRRDEGPAPIDLPPPRPLLLGGDLRQSEEFLRRIGRKDLRNLDLRGADLSGLDMAGVDLSGARLRGATLVGTNLSRANLSGADLSVANLQEADLTGATFAGASLRRSDLTDANLAGARIADADLRGSIRTPDRPRIRPVPTSPR